MLVQALWEVLRVARVVGFERGALFWARLIAEPVWWVFLLSSSVMQSRKGCNNRALTHNQKGVWDMNEFVFVKWMVPWIKSFVKPWDLSSITGFSFSSFLWKAIHWAYHFLSIFLINPNLVFYVHLYTSIELVCFSSERLLFDISCFHIFVCLLINQSSNKWQLHNSFSLFLVKHYFYKSQFFWNVFVYLKMDPI